MRWQYYSSRYKTVLLRARVLGLATSAGTDKQRIVKRKQPVKMSYIEMHLRHPLQNRMQEALLKANDSYGF